MTALAGFVDAVGYTAMGHLYLSFMSGNSTQFGMAVAGGNAHVVGWAGAVIATFLLGAFIGSLIHAAEGEIGMPLVLVCEFVCLISAWSLNGVIAQNCALLFVAVAMGMQNSLHKAVAGASTGKSFITGALFGTGDALARACLGRAHFAEAAANAISWLAFVAGVTNGAISVGAFGIGPALLGAAGFVVLLMILSILWRRRR
ncbi:YoaK family protein [Bradyrhizobium sp. MOS001]|jgi:oxalate decarboxylase|uniref:YoaK family protein n=1 Tax=Bradyrhizobium sp. MOS001 TaxID=2133948 RepID=UPI00142F8F0A|nr:YoaK family protein [Bradyrhizobium sp. MOS001]